jgi:putative transposase
MTTHPTGAYFITICTKNMHSYFGAITNGEMKLNPIGKIAHQYWLEIFNEFPNTIIDTFVIMPNHMHGIIIIDNNDIDTHAIHHVSIATNKNKIPIYSYMGIPINPEDEHLFLLPSPGGITGMDNPMLSNHSISKMIRWYKAKCSYEVRNVLKNEFSWHSKFYDHIIRDERDMDRIRSYIRNNPANFGKDKFYQ